MIGDFTVEIIVTAGAFLLGIVTTNLARHWKWLHRLLGSFGIHVRISRPQLDLDLEYELKADTTKVLIKNAGDQAAFNVYCFLFEIFSASENGDFKISSLGSEKIKAGVLAPSEKIIFKGKHVQFDGCNVTCEQEIWVEYTDETGQHYRTRIIPPTPRGDDLKVEPPIKIKYRMPRLPGLEYSGQNTYEPIRKGREGLRNGLHYM